MDQFDREDSSAYTNKPRQIEPETEQPVQQLTPTPKPKRSKAPFVLSLLLLLALTGCGLLGWYAYMQSDQRASLEGQSKGKDDQIADLKSQLASANSTIKDSTDDSDETTTDTSSSSSDVLIKSALAYSKTKVANQGYPSGASDLQATIDKQTSAFARVQVGSPTAGPGVDIVYFKKTGSDWVLLGDSNGNSDRFYQTFGMPSGF